MNGRKPAHVLAASLRSGLTISKIFELLYDDITVCGDGTRFIFLSINQSK